MHWLRIDGIKYEFYIAHTYVLSMAQLIIVTIIIYHNYNALINYQCYYCIIIPIIPENTFCNWCPPNGFCNAAPCYNDTIDLICHYPDVMERVNGQVRYVLPLTESLGRILFVPFWGYIHLRWRPTHPTAAGQGEGRRSWTWSCTGSDCVNGTFT